MKYKPTIVYVDPRDHKKLIKKLGLHKFSEWVRKKIKQAVK